MGAGKIIYLNRQQWELKITRQSGSSRMYLRLNYHDEIYERTTGIKDTPESREQLQSIVDDINHDLRSGAFVFGDAFPNAPEHYRRLFSEKEGRKYIAPPEAITFQQGYDLWNEEVFSRLPNPNKQDDYVKAIRPHILPYFKDMTFDEITHGVLCDFFSSRTQVKNGKKQRLATNRMKNIRTPLYAIWDFMVKRMRWEIPDPFVKITEYINEITTKQDIELDTSELSEEELNALMEEEETKASDNGREIMLFSDYLKALDCMDDYYRPNIELITLTGIIASEEAAIRTNLLHRDVLPIHFSIRNGILRNYLKNKSRKRQFKMTRAIRRVLQEGMERKKDSSMFIFRRQSGIELNDRAIRDAWEKACIKAGVPRCTPYELRHSFVAYCEMMEIPKSKIVYLMGHANKSMVDTVYGKYKIDLEKDIEAIKEYFGEDFWSNQ